MISRREWAAMLAPALLAGAAFACSAPAWCGDITGSKLALATVKLNRPVAAAERNSGHFWAEPAPVLLGNSPSAMAKPLPSLST